MNEANISKCLTRKWNIVINNSKVNYDVGSKSIYNTEGLKSNLCDYNDIYIFEKGDITVTASAVIQVAFKKYAPFTKCITKIDGTAINVTAYLDLIMSMYSLKQYSSNYFDTTDSSWFYSKNEAIKKFEEIRRN